MLTVSLSAENEEALIELMENKARDTRLLKMLHTDREALQQALNELDARIALITSSAALEFEGKAQAPIHLP